MADLTLQSREWARGVEWLRTIAESDPEKVNVGPARILMAMIEDQATVQGEPVAWRILVECRGPDTNGEWEVRYDFIEKDREEAEDRLKHFTVPNFVRRVDHEYRTYLHRLHARTHHSVVHPRHRLYGLREETEKGLHPIPVALNGCDFQIICGRVRRSASVLEPPEPTDQLPSR